MNFFTEEIIRWYNINKRNLPWRNCNDPYLIWLSEVILQQTKIEQGLSYYERFTQKYPTIKQLAEANSDDVMKLWQGLGYYSRARNMHLTAKQIVLERNGIFPNNYQDILNLKGVGNYTAAAIASFAFDLPYAVVDGNVYRVLSRVFGIKKPIDTGAGQKFFAKLAQQLLNINYPAIHNQAIMEFGSQQCRPLKPNCGVCPLKLNCKAYSTNSVNLLPRKKKSIKVSNRYFEYLIYIQKGKIFVAVFL